MLLGERLYQMTYMHLKYNGSLCDSSLKLKCDINSLQFGLQFIWTDGIKQGITLKRSRGWHGQVRWTAGMVHFCTRQILVLKLWNIFTLSCCSEKSTTWGSLVLKNNTSTIHPPLTLNKFIVDFRKGHRNEQTLPSKRIYVQFFFAINHIWSTGVGYLRSALNRYWWMHFIFGKTCFFNSSMNSSFTGYILVQDRH